MQTDFTRDVADIQSIPAVQSILEVICRTTGMGFAAVARVTPARWIACATRDEIAFGLKVGGELKIETTICTEVRANNRAVTIDHVAEDPLWREHHTPAMYGFQSYISVPIRLSNGEFFGTLCAIDPRPVQTSLAKIKPTFDLFAELIAQHLDNMRDMHMMEGKLEEERRLAELREQFIAITGHDLRNPVNAVLTSSQLLQRKELGGDAGKLVDIINHAAVRMRGLLENVIDLAKGQSADGLSVVRKPISDLTELLKQIIAEHEVTITGRDVRSSILIDRTVSADGKRLGQLVANLLANALMHGKAEHPIEIDAKCKDGFLVVSVRNATDPIPDNSIERLFQPFFRHSAEQEKQGLGLGLFIAAQIAKAHDGTLDVHIENGFIAFTFRMPTTDC